MEDIMGWRVDTSNEFTNCASHGRCEVDVYEFNGRRTLDVRIEEGSGYESYTATSSIPFEVIVRMMEHAGYSVSRREPVVG